jgi:hypothetical protein
MVVHTVGKNIVPPGTRENQTGFLAAVEAWHGQYR